jgi:hypothetical protein
VGEVLASCWLANVSRDIPQKLFAFQVFIEDDDKPMHSKLAFPTLACCNYRLLWRDRTRTFSV